MSFMGSKTGRKASVLGSEGVREILADHSWPLDSPPSTVVQTHRVLSRAETT